MQQVDHGMLTLFSAYWASPRKQLPKALERADEADYRQFGDIALKLKLLKPLSLLVPGRGDTFLDLYFAYRVDDLVDLTEALIEAEEIACLSRLADYVSKLSGKELKKLSKLIEEEADTPESFCSAVERAIAALPQNKGVKGVLRAIWRRSPEKG